MSFLSYLDSFKKCLNHLCEYLHFNKCNILLKFVVFNQIKWKCNLIFAYYYSFLKRRRNKKKGKKNRRKRFDYNKRYFDKRANSSDILSFVGRCLMNNVNYIPDKYIFLIRGENSERLNSLSKYSFSSFACIPTFYI